MHRNLLRKIGIASAYTALWGDKTARQERLMMRAVPERKFMPTGASASAREARALPRIQRSEALSVIGAISRV